MLAVAALVVMPVLPTGASLAAAPASPAADRFRPARHAASPAPPDSQEVRGEAEERQHAFEEWRRYQLETTWWRPVGTCDERVGRFCLWHSDDDAGPPPETDRVRERRRRLVAHLDAAARRIPGDPWVAGQRVRYLLASGRTAAALEAAGACRAEAWWCRALRGLVHHRAGRIRDAERSFERALAAMGRERACRWRNLGDLLEGDLAGRYRERACGARADLQRRIWWLADPFYLVRGNDRRSEHFARWVLDRTQRDAETPSGVPWGEDLQELLVRYGWPSGWERDVTTGGTEPSVISHYPVHGRRWMPPDLRAVLHPDSIQDDGWRLDPPGPRSEYAPPYLAAHGALRSQVTRLRRGDSALVVAAYELEAGAEAGEDAGGDGDRIRGWVRSGLFLRAGPAGPAASVTSRTEGRRGVLSTRSGTGGRLLSLEALAPADSVAARRRAGVRLPGAPGEGMAISDLMLVEAAADTLPASFGELLPRARPTSVYGPGERVGLYWELYGEGGGARSVETSVTLEREGGGLLRSLGDLLGIGGDPDAAVRVEWREPVAATTPVHPRSLVVRLPEDLPEGRYTLRVEAAAAAGGSVSAGRQIRVRGE